MKTRNLLFFLLSLTAFFFLPKNIYAEQDTIVEAGEISNPPLFDGIANDACWENATWQAIDQVWIPWNTPLESDDFTGRYKVVWSSTENLLYFAVEITDDVVSDAYEKGETADIYNFDMIEVFIDEDKSGGYHVFDGGGNNASQLGLNAENAFSYHIFAPIPEIGETSYEYYVTDIAGTGWGDRLDPDYSGHLPSFAISRLNENTWLYEFSLIVYDDTYTPENEEASRAILTAEKIMGLSLAANDDDEPDIDPSSTERDNMIGSVAVPEDEYNDHWMNADGYGTVKLVSPLSNINQVEKNTNVKAYYSFNSKNIIVETNNEINIPCKLKVISSSGQIVWNKDYPQKFTQTEISASKFQPGMYIVQFQSTSLTLNEKVVIR